MTLAQEDPEAFIKDLFKLEFLKRVLFQINDDIPWEIDMSFLQMMAPMMEMSMEMAMEEEGVQDEMAGMWSDTEWGYEYEDVATSADSFNEALHFWFSTQNAEGSMDMDYHSHVDVPIIMLVKLVGSFKDTVSGENVDVDCKVIEIGNNAEGWIEGEPQLWSFDMMGDAMGGMMGGT